MQKASVSEITLPHRNLSLNRWATRHEMELKDLVSCNPGLALSLQADEGVPYRTVAKVIANIQTSGVSKLSVLTPPGG